MKLNRSKFPDFMQLLVFDYLKPSNYNTPTESLLLTLLAACSKVMCFNRVKVVDEDINVDTFCNVYGITFMESGSGKDKPMKDLERKLEFLGDHYDDIFKEYDTRARNVVRTHAEELNGSKAEKTKYISEHAPRRLEIDFYDATVEGVMVLREEFQKAGIGFCHYGNSEFIDYISSNSESRKGMVNFIKEIYDHGDSASKQIKGNKDSVSVKGVPQTMLVHSSIAGLVDDSKAIKNLFDFFARGMARRCLVCYPEEMKFERQSKEEIAADAEMAKSVAPFIYQVFNDTYNATKPEIPLVYEDVEFEYLSYKHITLSPEVKDAYNDYHGDNQEAASKFSSSKMSSQNVSIIKTEIRGRAWKTIKIAGVIAGFDHPEDLSVHLSDWECAVYITEFFGNQFSRFFFDDKPDHEKLYDFICSHESVSTMDVRDKKFVNNNYFKKWFAENLEIVREMCAVNDEILVESSGKNGTRMYSIESIEVPSIDSVALSIGTSDRPQDTSFTPTSVEFSSIDSIVCGPVNYSPCFFKDNYRKGDNWLGGEELIMIDIDNDEGELSLTDCYSLFKDYKCCIITTKSHGIDKKSHGVKDRYRIIIPVGKMDASKDTVKNVTSSIIREFGLTPYMDRGATSDVARFYFPSPSDAIVWYSPGDTVIDWQSRNTAPVVVEELPDYSHHNIKQYDAGDTFINYAKLMTGRKMNELPAGQTFRTKQGDCKFSEFGILTPGNTMPCHCCIAGHEDKNASAFIGCSNERKLFFRCTACNVTLWKES